MNIQLYIEGKLCDFDKKTYFNLQKEFQDEQELIVKEIEYSYTISIPTSDRNKQILGYIDSFDVPNKFGRVYDAELYVDEILIIKGKLKLSEIDDEYFKGNLYKPASKTVSDILGDRMLNEIIPHMKPMNNMTDYARQNCYVMNWYDTSTYPEYYKYWDRHICYPYLLYSLPYNDAQKAYEKNLGFYTQDLNYGVHTMNADNIFPAFNVLSVIKDMFATEGYNVQGNIFGDEKFNDLFQTFNYNYSDYLENKQVPYYLNLRCVYDNYKLGNIPSTLQTATIWVDAERHYEDATFDGRFEYGVDDPLTSDADNSYIGVISNDQHMLTNGSSTNGKMIYVPKSGWYRINCFGTMQYPDRGGDYETDGDKEYVGGTNCDRDDTDLSELPFEFQIKKGFPAENPKLYSFNSFVPCMPSSYSETSSVLYEDRDTVIKCFDKESTRLYGKNGKTTYINDYSDFPTNDFVAGVRLGGAFFSDFTGVDGAGETMQQPARFAHKGAGLALPDVEQQMEVREFNNEKYLTLWDFDARKRKDYEERTAQVLVRRDSYSNFEGYNVADWNTKTWNTTSNPYRVTYQGAENSSAITQGKYNGSWNINTVVWLEQGDTLYFELLMPRHIRGRYESNGFFGGHKHWHATTWHTNRTMVDFRFEMGIITTNKKWSPTVDEPIPPFEEILKNKETNVNQFLPQIKCNDYLKSFLQTFNLQLTMVNNNTFSIDYAMMNNVMGNVISIENLANIKDAEFKALDLPSTRQLGWKIDKAETGYVDGNQSPYNNEGDLPWYNSGYTGGISITNETNTSGSIDKKESQWSYNWYKTIQFIPPTNDFNATITKNPAAIPVISDATTWDSHKSSYFMTEGEALPTSKTMRFFFLSKRAVDGQYDYIQFKFDETSDTHYDAITGVFNTKDYYTRLLIPSNYIETEPIDNTFRRYMLDYNNSPKSTNNGDWKTITDVFFNLQVQSGYEINVPIKLSNDLYTKINGGTLVKFNDGLYKVKQIDGHDVTEQDDATLTLLTLK